MTKHLVLLQESPVMSSQMDAPCSTRVSYAAMKDVKDVRVTAGQNYHNIGWGVPVSATRKSTWAVAIVAAAHHV